MTARRAAQESVASLRLPVPFFDLLMVLLVTCLVFVAPVRPENDVRAMDVPIAQGQGGSTSAATLLPVVPKHLGQGWVFTVLGEAQPTTPEALAARARAENHKVVLVVAPTTPLQDFVGLQTVLTKAQVPFALAVQNKETSP